MTEVFGSYFVAFRFSPYPSETWVREDGSKTIPVDGRCLDIAGMHQTYQNRVNGKINYLFSYDFFLKHGTN